MPRAPTEEEAAVAAADAAAAQDAPLTPEPTPLPVAVLEEAPALGKSKAVVVVGNHRFPSDRSKTMVIVTEQRSVTMNDAGDAVERVDIKYDGYPSGADLYYRTDALIDFPKGSTILTLGHDVQQGLFWGFSPDVRWVHVGPSSPAFGAANLAWQRGATEIEIIGLDDREKAQLQPFIDALPTDTVAPTAAKVTLS